MDIRESTKTATALAKSGDYDGAISLLQSIIPKMAKTGGFSGGLYTKIIPYFQKAGRYKEGVEYAERTLIPAFRDDCKKTFGHKCKEIQEAFQNLGVSSVYEKLKLCAKREKSPDDESLFERYAKDFHSQYEKLLEAGELIELQKEYEQAIDLFGKNPKSWPDSVRNRLARFINT
ncbi:hypothetical protein [Halomonas sp. HL-93]|uniref:hypothetical protein n=1 Tax=Halomonas sp. HL-93 TaxID=1666906 RepID=UPI0006D9439C|nr:hypothetical protein [Halomonas sp. HL-93]KPQ20222.1 MAG: hypothetical protein HLUCCO06_05185 [Halomonas sp. HL-93]SBR51074.1 hypothetical protein GA0071314_3012 [Halomonas sp. HL-93]